MTITATMQAIVQDQYGAPDVLALREIARPTPADEEVLIRIHAASLNARDWHIMRGDPYVVRFVDRAVFGRRGPQWRVRGSDFAGRVEAVGRTVTRFRPGDEVYGGLREADGAFAEYICVAESAVERKPATWTFEQAAAVPLAATTALLGVRDAARIQRGQRLLINGASGGVGTFAVQLGKAFGAEVTAVCRTRNLDLVRSIGADQAIDYTQVDFARTAERYDAVFDLVGNRSLTSCRRVLTPTGTLVLSGGGVSTGGSLFGPMALFLRAQAVSRFVSQRIVRLAVPANTEHLAALGELAETGKLTPVIDRTYPLRDVPAAIRYLETEHARAKVVITMGPTE